MLYMGLGLGSRRLHSDKPGVGFRGLGFRVVLGFFPSDLARTSRQCRVRLGVLGLGFEVLYGLWGVALSTRTLAQAGTDSGEGRGFCDFTH